MRPGRSLILILLLWGCSSQRVPSPHLRVPSPPALERQPNIIFFLVDDLGWMDTGAYGSRYYETPNIDRLARMGMLFTDAYASSVCSPTRASILTGKYPLRLGITGAYGAHAPRPPDADLYPQTGPKLIKWLLPESRRFLPLEELTVAEALQQGGYRTAHVGKWHLGLPPEYWPDRQGFEVVFQAPNAGPPSYTSPYGFQAGSITDGPDGEYITDRLTDEALDFIEANRERPFFLHLSHFGVHGPWGYKEELRSRFAKRLDPRHKQDNPVMAAMIQSVDESLGRILSRLEDLGLSDRTIVIFYSDNGGTMWPRMPPDDLMPTNNSPLRGSKGVIYEGGIRVPLIVSWPGVTEAGSRSSEVVSSVDFYPTILQMAGVARKPTQELDGESLVPVLDGSGGLRRKAVFNSGGHNGVRAPYGVTVRSGQWKLIRWYGAVPPYFPEQLELYDLHADIGETTNLARRFPELTRQLDAHIDRFLKSSRVPPPKPNPAFESRSATLGGWKPLLTRVRIEDGVLRVLLSEHPAREGSGLRLGLLVHPAERWLGGPHLLELRARAGQDVHGTLRLSHPELTDEPEHTQAFDIAGGSRWRDLRLTIPIRRPPVDLQLEFAASEVDVEIDRIRVRALDYDAGYWPAYTPTLLWPFDPIAEPSGNERFVS